MFMHECVARFLRTPFRGVLTAHTQANGLTVCLWKCQDGFVRQQWNTVPQSSLIPSSNYTYTPSCVPLPSTFVAVEFEFHLYVNVQVTQNSTTVDFSEDFYNELDALSEQMKQETLTQGLDDPIVILKIKYSLFDTNQYHEILYSNSVKKGSSAAHEFYPVQTRR